MLDMEINQVPKNFKSMWKGSGNSNFVVIFPHFPRYISTSHVTSLQPASGLEGSRLQCPVDSLSSNVQ